MEQWLELFPATFVAKYLVVWYLLGWLFSRAFSCRGFGIFCKTSFFPSLHIILPFTKTNTLKSWEKGFECKNGLGFTDEYVIHIYFWFKTPIYFSFEFWLESTGKKCWHFFPFKKFVKMSFYQKLFIIVVKFIDMRHKEAYLSEKKENVLSSQKSWYA